MSTSVTLTEEKPSAGIELLMLGGGSLTGQLIDADTGEPAVGVRVSAGLIRHLLDKRYTISDDTARTDAEGRFTIANAAAGEYALAVEPFATDSARWIENFTAEDLAKVESGYESRYFPGGPSLGEVLPVTIATRATTNVGTLRVKRVDLYRARIGLPQPDCPAGATFRVRIVPGAAASLFVPSSVLKEVRCGQSLLARGLAAGTYTLVGQIIAGAKEPGYAIESLPIRGEHARIDLHPRKGLPFEGSLVLAEGAGNPDFTDVIVGLRFTDTVGIGRNLTSFRPDDQRNFGTLDMFPGEATVRVAQLPAGVYVKQVRYNGIVQPDLRFEFNGQGKLEVIIDSGAGKVTGRVTERDAAASGARVLFVKWPMIADDLLQSLEETIANEDGRFRAYLAPGEYRVFALSKAQYGRLTELGVYERLATAGQRLTVARNSSSKLTIDVSDPSR